MLIFFRHGTYSIRCVFGGKCGAVCTIFQVKAKGERKQFVGIIKSDCVAFSVFCNRFDFTIPGQLDAAPVYFCQCSLLPQSVFQQERAGRYRSYFRCLKCYLPAGDKVGSGAQRVRLSECIFRLIAALIIESINQIAFYERVNRNTFLSGRRFQAHNDCFIETEIELLNRHGASL